MWLILLVYSVTNWKLFNTYSLIELLQKNTWKVVARALDIPIPYSFDSLAIFWQQKKQAIVINMVTTAILWSLWLRTILFFRVEHGEA